MTDQHALYIDGNWVNTPEALANLNPSDTHDLIGHYAQASTDQVKEAIAAANRAVAQWGQSPLETRYQVLMAIGDELIERSAELGELLAREEGKTRAEGVGELEVGELERLRLSAHAQANEYIAFYRPTTDD